MVGAEGYEQHPAMVEATERLAHANRIRTASAGLLSLCLGASSLGGATVYGIETYIHVNKKCEMDSSAYAAEANAALSQAESGQRSDPVTTKSYAGSIASTQLEFSSGRLTFYTPPITPKEINDISGAWLLDQTERFGELYGIAIEPYDGSQDADLKNTDATPFGSINVESTTTKQAMLGIMQGLSELPVEFVKDMGVEHMYLAGDIAGLAGQASTDETHKGTIVFNMSLPINDQTTVHEMTHELDGVQCGGNVGQINDPAYLGHNDGQIYSDESPVKLEQKPVSALAKFYPTARGASYLESLKFDCIGLAVAYKQIQVESDYSYNNVVEDKAELGSAILINETEGGVFDSRSPRLRAKAIELVSRIRMQSSSMFDYIMWRYQKDSASVQANPTCSTNNTHS